MEGILRGGRVIGGEPERDTGMDVEYPGAFKRRGVELPD